MDSFIESDHSSNVLKEIHGFIRCNVLCDVVLVAAVDERRINVHRVILAACSPYFKAMFTGALLESREQVVTLQDLHGDILEILINFCYTGTIELRQDVVESVFIAAHLLQFDQVIEECVNYFIDNLHYSNCLGYAAFAEKYECTQLFKRALDYACKHYSHVSQCEEFHALSADRLSKLLASDDITVASEAIVFGSLLSWVQADSEMRLKEVPRLLPFIRLPLLSVSFLADFVKPLCTNWNSLQLLTEALFWHSLPDKRLANCSLNDTPRQKYYESLILVFNRVSSHLPDLYDANLNQWSVWNEMPLDIIAIYSCIMFEKKLFLYVKNQQVQYIIKCFDFIHMRWSEFAVSSRVKGVCTLVSFRDTIYIFGGMHDVTMEWNPNTNEYHDVSPLLTPRQKFGAVVLGNYLYLIGGVCWDGANLMELDFLDRFDGNNWTRKRSMLYKRSGFATAVYNNFIYVFGGRCGNRVIHKVERYDTKLDKWTTVCNLENACVNSGCVLYENKILLIGGMNNQECGTDAVYAYDTLEKTVTVMPNLVHIYEVAYAVLIPNIMK